MTSQVSSEEHGHSYVKAWELSLNSQSQEIRDASCSGTTPDREADLGCGCAVDLGNACRNAQMSLPCDFFESYCGTSESLGDPPDSDPPGPMEIPVAPTARSSGKSKSQKKRLPDPKATSPKVNVATLPNAGPSPFFDTTTGSLERPVASTSLEGKRMDDFAGPNEFHATCSMHPGSLPDATPARPSLDTMATGTSLEMVPAGPLPDTMPAGMQPQPTRPLFESNGGTSTLPTNSNPRKRGGGAIPPGRPTKLRRTELPVPQIGNGPAVVAHSEIGERFHDEDGRGERSSRKAKRKPPSTYKGMPMEEWKGSRAYLSRKHVCDCGDRFDRTDNLDRHIRSVHDEISVWWCPNRGCNEEYVRKDNGMQHLKLRHKNVCSACAGNFDDPAALVAHLEESTDCRS